MAVLGAAMAIAAAPHGALDKNGVPLALYFPPIPTPVWVHRELLFSSGKLHLEDLHPAVAREIKATLAQPPVNGCIRLGHVDEQRVLNRAHGTLDDDMRSAPMILQSVVVSEAQGFYGYTPGTLLKLRVERSVRGQTSKELFAFVPMGEIVLGQLRICKSDPEYAPLPKVGDRVLSFTARAGGEFGNVLTFDGPDDWALLKGGKAVFARARADELRTTGRTVSLDDVVYEVEGYDRREKGSSR